MLNGMKRKLLSREGPCGDVAGHCKKSRTVAALALAPSLTDRLLVSRSCQTNTFQHQENQ